MTSTSEADEHAKTRIVLWIAIPAVAVVALLAVFLANRTNGTSATGANQFKFQVGQPGPGATAPPIQLIANDQTPFRLADYTGKNVLLYFQEGVGCQPCWDQMTDIEQRRNSFQALGIDNIVSITTSPAGQVKEKAAQEKVSMPVLSDPDLAVSKAYGANDYGMMGNQMDGHSFILVGPDGKIRWRADYGGAPDYTMYVPSKALLADIRSGLADSGQGT